MVVMNAVEEITICFLCWKWNPDSRDIQDRAHRYTESYPGCPMPAPNLDMPHLTNNSIFQSSCCGLSGNAVESVNEFGFQNNFSLINLFPIQHSPYPLIPNNRGCAKHVHLKYVSLVLFNIGLCGFAAS
jgi:hypothetical protein